MFIVIYYIVIYELQKEVDESGVKVFMSQYCLLVEEWVQVFFDKLYDIFVCKVDILQGYFSFLEDVLFLGYFQVFVDGGMMEEVFFFFFREIMNVL